MGRIEVEGDRLTSSVIGAAIEVHQSLGPGLLESAYSKCLAHELSLRKIKFQREIDLPVQYKGIKLATGYRADLIVEGALIVEVKVVSKLEDVHTEQILTYMKMSSIRKGLLLNFNVAILKKGIQRVVL